MAFFSRAEKIFSDCWELPCMKQDDDDNDNEKEEEPFVGLLCASYHFPPSVSPRLPRLICRRLMHLQSLAGGWTRWPSSSSSFPFNDSVGIVCLRSCFALFFVSRVASTNKRVNVTLWVESETEHKQKRWECSGHNGRILEYWHPLCLKGTKRRARERERLLQFKVKEFSLTPGP